MTPFVPKGKKGYRLRVTDLDGRSRVLLCGTRDRGTAEDMEAMLDRFRQRRGNGTYRTLLAWLVDRRVKLLAVYDADCAGGDAALDALVMSLTLQPAPEPELDLSPLVDEWDGRGRKAKSPRYVTQVRRFIPAGVPFPASRFRRREIAKFLEELPVDDPTRNRYKAALSQFANWLIRRELLETNPVRDAGVFSENPPRMTWLVPVQARALVEALAGEAQFVAALMGVYAAEWQAIEVGRARDLDLKERTYHAHGRKTARDGGWRDRICEFPDDPAWAWAWPIIERYARQLTPNAPITTRHEWQVLRAQTAACKALGLPHHTLHDWRHTYAVNAILRDDEHQAIKRQLGHAPNSTLLYEVYGAYIAEAKRRKQAQAASSTPAATPKRKRVK
jgi:integrase